MYFYLIFASLLLNTITTEANWSNNTRIKRGFSWFWGKSNNENNYSEDTSTHSYLYDIYNFFVPQKPNFRTPGRRISEVKCFEYNWERKVSEENFRKKQESEHDRIFLIGGRPSFPDEFPHMGALGWRSIDGSWIFKCGSTLISPTYTLTAAHCSKSRKDINTLHTVPEIVRFGILIVGMQMNDAMISKIILHPQFRSPKKYYDIALVKLDREMIFWSSVQPACLWSKLDTSHLGSQATITGWGVTDEATQRTSSILQAAEVDILHTSYCNELLRRACNRLWCRLARHQICAGKLSGGVDTCQGDSGGPLQVKTTLPELQGRSMYFVIGVTSFGLRCARPNQPGVYTRVSYFIDWIENIVWPEH